jgi:hypothetical protein
MNNRLGYFLLFCTVCFFSCRRPPVQVTTPAEPEKVNKVTVHNIDYTFFSSKGRMQLEADGSNLSASLTTRMKKDSIIWVTLSPGLGIEAIRAKITPDSIQIVDRINRHYYAGNFDLLRERYNVDLNFEILQNILVGNYTPGHLTYEKLLAEEPAQHSRQKRGSLVVDQFVDATTFKLVRLEAQDEATANQITADYQDFAPLGAWPFANSLLIAIKGRRDGTPTTSVVSINHRQVTLNESHLSFPFSVPSGYERR